MKHLEDSIQKQLVLWCKQHPNKLLHDVFHVPNGELRAKMVAIRLEKMGVKAGIPDLCFPLDNGKIFWLELKTQKGRLSRTQKAVIEMLKKKGHMVEVAYGYDHAIEILRKVLYNEVS